MKPIQWGILGTGSIAKAFADALQETDGELIAVASNKASRAKEFSATYNCLPLEGYENLISLSELDAIYVATPHTSHFELTAECLRLKKAVLCEKPMTINYEQAASILKVIEENKISFLEGFVYRHHKQSQFLHNLIKAGEIGDIHKVESSFGYKVKKTDPNSRLFNKHLGGGAILDVGCYTTSFCLMVAKSISEQNLSNFKLQNIKGSKGLTDVDESAEADLIFNGNLKMSIKTSIRENLKNNCVIYGSKGKILIANPWVPNQKSIIEIYNGNNYYKQFIKSEYTAYAQQIDFFNNKNFGKKINLVDTFMSNKESLINMKILDDWKKGFF